MSFPDSYQCPITNCMHKVVYQEQNKEAFLNYVNEEIKDTQKKNTNKYFAIHTDRSLKTFGFNDLFVIEIAQCFRDFPNLQYYKIDTNVEQYVNLEDGFIIFQPDHDVKSAIKKLIKTQGIHIIFYDLMHEYPVLASNDIRIYMTSSKLIDTIIRNGKTSYSFKYSLEKAVLSINFKCMENIDAIKNLPDVDFPKLIFECQNKSEEEVIDTYRELLPYYSSRAALVALSIFPVIQSFTTLSNINNANQKVINRILYEESQAKYGSVLVKQLTIAHSLLNNIEKHPHASWLFIENLLVQIDDIPKIKSDFKYLPDLQELRTFCLKKLGVMKDDGLPPPESQSFATSSPFSTKMAKFKITGELHDLLRSQYQELVSEREGKTVEFEDVIESFENPLLMTCLESISEIPTKSIRDEQYQKVFEAIINSSN